MSQQPRESLHPILPRLKDTARIEGFNDAGKWSAREAAELEILSESLNVEKVQVDINSIPDMWARPLLFEMALFDPNHLLHERVLGEWRGLLAMLALREQLALYDLTALPVTLPRVAGGQRGQIQSPGFLEALSKLAPEKSLASDTDWNSLYVIMVKSSPIGMTSPTTLVCTATDYYNRIHNIPWMNGAFLCDPAPSISASHKRDLAAWLNLLTRNLERHAGLYNNSKEWNTLLGIMNDFVENLGGATQTAPKLTQAGLGMGTGIFAHLDKPVEGEDQGNSHVRLMPSREDAPDLPILVVDRSIAGQWHMPEHDIIIWRGIPLDTAIPFSGLAGRTDEIAGRRFTGAEVWEPGTFFTEKLFVVKQQAAFPGTMKVGIHGSDMLRYQPQGDVVTPILPIRERLLEYLDAKDLSSRFSFEQINDGILVRLRLRLSGPEGNGKEFIISREYRFSDNEVILIRNVPVLEIWPNFKTAGNSWKAYYTYFSPAGEVDVFYAQPIARGAKKDVQTFKDSRAEISREITRLSHFPEAMSCKALVANPQTNSMEPHSAGVLLIDQPEPLPPQTRTIRIGIDFGATNTNVYTLRQGDAIPSPVVFKDRFLRVTASSEASRTLLYDNFLPGLDERTPFQSLFHDFQLSPDAPELRPLLDGHILFLLEYDKFDASIPGIATDLKWSEKPEDRIRTRAFLKQLCLQASAEAVALGANTVAWAYSFPTSFSDKVRQGFPQMWYAITNDCLALTGLSINGGPYSQSESVASALFFRLHHNAPLARGTVCIDIGGSTSDIAIWQTNRLIWQTSLRLAGRDMFLKLLYRNPGVLQPFSPNVSRLRPGNSLTAFYAEADAIINGEGDEWFRRLPDHIGTPEVQRFIQLIAVGMSGMFYYIGMVLQYLVANKEYHQEIPSVYVGGNASRLLHWLAAGRYGNNSPVTKLLKSMLLRASSFEGRTEDFNVVMSQAPKAEAAYGLVCSGQLEFNGRVEEGVVAGEMFLEGGQERNWDQLLNSERLRLGIKEPVLLDRLQDFLQTFNRYAESRDTVVLPLSNLDSLMRQVTSRLANSLMDFRETEVEAILVEPIFILALKHLLEVKAEELPSSAHAGGS